MSNLLAVLKAEITRLSRREAKKLASPIRNRVNPLVRFSANQKRQIASLDKRITRLERLLEESRQMVVSAAPEEVEKARVSPRLVKAQRKRLKLNQENFARLLGVSVAAIRAWEQGRSGPRKENLASFVAVRKMKVSEARLRLGIEAKRKRRRKIS